MRLSLVSRPWPTVRARLIPTILLTAVLAWAGVIAALSAAPPAWSAEGKVVSCLPMGESPAKTCVALVIGNTAYKKAGRLPNAEVDADAVGAQLAALGFDVTVAKNLDVAAFDGTLDAFYKKAKQAKADVALFYYAGHAVQVGQSNYLLPITAELQTENALQRETVVAQTVVTRLEGAAKVSLIFLDACRNNPLAEKLGEALAQEGRAADVGRGLVRMSGGASRDTLIVYAAEPGEEAFDGVDGAGHSPFAAAFLAHVATPGLEVEVMLKRVTTQVSEATLASAKAKNRAPQKPERLSKLESEFYFKPTVVAKPPEASVKPVVPPAPPSVDTGQGGLLGIAEREWNGGLKDSRDIRSLKRFATNFPGYFGDLAADRMALLEQETAEEKRRAEAEQQRLALLTQQERARQQAEAERKAREEADRRKIEEDNRRKASELGRNPGTEFQDCWTGSGGASSVVVVAKGTPVDGAKGLARGQVCAPRMVVVPGGKFLRGSSPDEIAKLTKEYGSDLFVNEGPQREVTIGQPFAVGKFEVTFAEWDACVADGGCKYKPDDSWGRGPQPVMNVSYDDITKEYLPWLNKKTGQTYRLLTEAEWEYAARGGPEAKAGGTLRYWWGNDASHEYANYGKDACCSGLKQGKDQWENTAPVGQFPANPFGLHDLHGNVWEWVEDCWHENYSGAPSDGAAWTTSCNGTSRVLRGGSWSINPRGLRAASRFRLLPGSRNDSCGFRLARTLHP